MSGSGDPTQLSLRRHVECEEDLNWLEHSPCKRAKMLYSPPRLLDLPTELLLMILNFLEFGDLLGRVALVCKTLFALIQDATLNRIMHISKYDNREKVLHFMVTRQLSIQHVHLECANRGRVPSFRMNFLRHVSAKLPHLKQLTLLGYKYGSSSVLADLLNKVTFKELTALHLTHASLELSLVQDIIHKRAPILRTLCMAPITSPSRQLAHIKYSGLDLCLRLQSLEVHEKVMPEFLNLLGPLHQLRELVLSNLSDTISKADWCTLLSQVNWQRLQVLKLMHARDFDFECWTSVWAAAPHLELLHLGGCKKLVFRKNLQTNTNSNTQGWNLRRLLLSDVPQLSLAELLQVSSYFSKLELLQMSFDGLTSTALLAALLAEKQWLVVSIRHQAYFHAHITSTQMALLYGKHRSFISHCKLILI